MGVINKTINGKIDMIQLGKSEKVRIGPFIGLGPIHITARAAEEEKTVKGTQFVIFSIVR